MGISVAYSSLSLGIYYHSLYLSSRSLCLGLSRRLSLIFCFLCLSFSPLVSSVRL